MNERDVENLLLVVDEQERAIRDLQRRVNSLETGLTRFTRENDEALQHIWRAIRRLVVSTEEEGKPS